MRKIAKRLLVYLFNPIYRRWLFINETLEVQNKNIQKLEKKLNKFESAFELFSRYPKFYDSDEFGFNGQVYRKKIFENIISKIDFKSIIETGTWIGNTTGYFATKFNFQIYTVELQFSYKVIAQMRLEKFKKRIHFELGDSRIFLTKLTKKLNKNEPVFFYLDAHWYEDLPLEKELEIICSSWQNFVILIDDFKVPNDEGYGYDDYGNGKSLELKTFKTVFLKYNLSIFFPSIPSEKESGFKRGYVLLSNNKEMISNLSALSGLSVLQ